LIVLLKGGRNVRVLCAALLVIACSASQTGPDEPSAGHLVVLQPEHDVRIEDFRYRAEIPFRYTNATGRTLVIIGCNPPRPPLLEWWTGVEWRAAFEHIELLCLSQPFVIAPGTVIVDTLRLAVARDSIGPTGHRIRPHWQASHGVGEYRLVWSLRDPARPDANDPWLGGAARPLAERVSNTFRLRIVTP
jgi:hypothetical protein